MRFAIFPLHLCKVLPCKSDDLTKRCTCHAKSSSQNWSSYAPKCSPLRKSVPGPPNISDEHVSCIAPATENASLQILFKCPTPPNVFETAAAAKTLTFCSLLTRCKIPCACHAKRHLNAQKCRVLRATRRTLFQHLNFQKCSDTELLCTCWLRNVLPATTAWTFSSSQLPKVLRAWCALYVFCFEMCLPPQRRALFRDLNFQSAPGMVCFVRFYFEMCFAPQRRALFSHRNFQKWSECEVLSTFWLPHVLCVTTACNFSSRI